jgi:hypothetical protein
MSMTCAEKTRPIRVIIRYLNLLGLFKKLFLVIWLILDRSCLRARGLLDLRIFRFPAIPIVNVRITVARLIRLSENGCLILRQRGRGEFALFIS